LAENVRVAAAGPRSPHEGPHRRPQEGPGRAGEKEANDITTILTELQKTIQDELDEASDEVQLQLFSTPEKEQFDRNADALRARLRAIPGEIEKETEAIKARFADPQRGCSRWP